MAFIRGVGDTAPMLGAWATTVVTLMAAIAFALASAATWTRKAKEMSLFYGGVSVFLLIGGMRQVAALAGAEAADRALFYALLVPAAVPIIFLVAMAGRARTGRHHWPSIMIWTVAIAIGLWHAFWQGLDGPFVGDWGTEYRVRSSITQLILIAFVTLPGLAIGAMTWWTGHKLEDAHGLRLRWVGYSVFVYYAAFTIDALAPRGMSILLTRAATLIVALAVAWAYHRRTETMPQASPESS